MTLFEARRSQQFEHSDDGATAGGVEDDIRKHPLLLTEFSGVQFTHVSTEDTKVTLAAVGYGENMMRVDSFYFAVTDRGPIAVATYEVPAHLTEGHFGIHRGVEQVENMAQATLLMARYTQSGADAANLRPLFTGIGDFQFTGMALPGMTINILVKGLESPEGSKDFRSEGEVVFGNKLLSYGSVRGTFIDGRFIDIQKKRTQRDLGKTLPIYPIRQG